MLNCGYVHTVRAPFIKIIFTIFVSLIAANTFAQKKSATLSGKVVDENDKPLAKVSITILGRQTGTVSSDSGTFVIKTPADKAFAVVFTYTGYKKEQRNFLLNENEKESVVVRLEHARGELEAVTITDQRSRNEPGLI